MTKQLIVIAPSCITFAEILLPASKSISNRLLIIHEMCDRGFEIEQLSEAEDTRILKSLLDHPADVEDCGAGGTTFRFLLALRALQGREVMLTGSPRLLERPVQELVIALKELGADISYVGKEGFPPLKIRKGNMSGGRIEIRADVSSQFISALLLIAPAFQSGLELALSGKVVSAPYISMTIELMNYFGVKVQQEANILKVDHGRYVPVSFQVAPDWSAAAFFYVIAALNPDVAITLKGLGHDVLQGDRKLATLMLDWGVKTTREGNDIVIVGSGVPAGDVKYNFSETPDLAQAFAVMAAVSNRHLHLKGLSTLIGKETNRLAAMQTELKKVGCLVEITDDSMEVIQGLTKELLPGIVFDTYADHRMVMALSLISLTGFPVMIDSPDHVSKSFPNYFDQLKRLGFIINTSPAQ